MIERLKSRGFKLHKQCYDRFNDSKLNRARSTRKRKKSSEGESGRVTRGQCPPSVLSKEQLCMYCGKPPRVDPKHYGNNVPLHAAAGKLIASEYVDTFTESLRTMAAKLGDTKLQNLLGSDIISSELYYHNPCHANFKRKYDNIIRQKNVQVRKMVRSLWNSLQSLQLKIMLMTEVRIHFR